jgi:hypothetical protein
MMFALLAVALLSLSRQTDETVLLLDQDMPRPSPLLVQPSPSPHGVAASVALGIDDVQVSDLHHFWNVFPIRVVQSETQDDLRRLGIIARKKTLALVTQTLMITQPLD